MIFLGSVTGSLLYKTRRQLIRVESIVISNEF